MIRIGVGIVPTPYLEVGEAAVVRAEQAGIDSVWLPDHLMAFNAECLWPDVGNIASFVPSPHNWLDPLPVIANWSRLAPTLRFGTAVTDPFRRPPAVLASSSLTLSHLTKGRFVLGIGAGGSLNTSPYGMPFEQPVARLQEALEIIRLLWDQQRVTYEGRFWTLRDAVCAIGPYDGRFPEIWIGAEGPRMLDLVGRYGDGWIPGALGTAPLPEHYASMLQSVRASAEHAGRDPEAITPSLSSFTMLVDEHDAAHRMMTSSGFRQLLLVQSPEFFAREGLEHPLGSSGVTLVPEWVTEPELRAALSAIPDRPIGHDVVFHGTPQDVAEQLVPYADAGLRHLIATDVSPLCDVGQLSGMPARVGELARILT